MVFVRSVRKIQTSDVHSGFDHFLQSGYLGGGRPLNNITESEYELMVRTIGVRY